MPQYSYNNMIIILTNIIILELLCLLDLHLQVLENYFLASVKRYKNSKN